MVRFIAVKAPLETRDPAMMISQGFLGALIIYNFVGDIAIS